MMLIHPIHEHSICFHLFVSFSISSLSVLYFSKHKPFTCLVKFIPTYFIIIVIINAMVNGIVFLSFFFWLFILGVQKCMQFMNIDFVSCTLLNSFNRLDRILMESIGFSMYTIMSSVNNEFCFLLSNLDFISCLITVARTSNTMLNRVVEADTLDLFLILRKARSVFTHWVLSVGSRFFVYGLYCIEVFSLHAHFA